MPVELAKLLEKRSLPVAFRGYDRDTTDDLLTKLEAVLKEAISDRSDAQARVAELEQRIADGRKHQEAVTEALVVAARVRADSEREAKELKASATRESELIRSEGEKKADEVVEAAEVKAKEILEDARSKARAYEIEIRYARQLAHRTRARFKTFLQSLRAEVNSPQADLMSAVDDLVTRAGEARGACAPTQTPLSPERTPQEQLRPHE